MSVTHITDHIGEAIARLPSRYREQASIEALLRTLVTPIQTLEDALFELISERGIETGSGITLDMIGTLIGEPRAAAQVGDDDGYRPYLRGRIATNRSQGTVESLIRVARAILNDATARVVVAQPGVAATVVRVADAAVTAATAAAAIYFLRDAKKAGVRLILESSTVAPSSTFCFSGGDGLGFATTGVAGSGGSFSSADE